MPPLTSASVSRETLDRLELLVDLLRRWNTTVNLVSRDSLENAWSRHVEDSLLLVPHLAGTRRAADLGAGAGFPGLVLAICCGIDYVLIEADARKASFLREAIRLTDAPADVHIGRVEAFTHESFALITARGYAPLSRLLSTSKHLLAQGGRYLLLKGAQADAEIATAALDHEFAIVRHAVAGSPGEVLDIRFPAGNAG